LALKEKKSKAIVGLYESSNIPFVPFRDKHDLPTPAFPRTTIWDNFSF